MEILVCTRSKDKAHFIHSCADYFASELKLDRSKYTLIIYTATNLRKNENSYGQTGLLYESNTVIGMTIDSRLTQERLIETIAHEMVHVKQLAKGQLKHVRARNGRVVDVWLGKRIKTTYWNAPWEREAYRRERELAMKLMGMVAEKMKKS